MKSHTRQRLAKLVEKVLVKNGKTGIKITRDAIIQLRENVPMILD